MDRISQLIYKVTLAKPREISIGDNITVTVAKLPDSSVEVIINAPVSVNLESKVSEKMQDRIQKLRKVSAKKKREKLSKLTKAFYSGSHNETLQ